MHEPLLPGEAETGTPDFLHRNRIAVDAGTAVTHVVHRDFETRGQLDLKKVGVHKYATHPSTEILCVAYAVDDGPVEIWLPGNPPPPVWFEAACNTNWTAAAHADHFESTFEQHILVPRYGFPLIPIERHRCTQAAALALGLPARLSTVANALELVNRKDAAGERLMHQMSKPRRAHKDEDPNVVHWFEDAERLQRLYGYAIQDVEVERELHDQLLALSPTEQARWELSCAINERGFCVDRNFAGAARQIARAAIPEIDIELARITDGRVTGANQIARLQIWLQEQGCAIESLSKKVLEKLLLDPELPTHVQQVLELRLGGAQAAVKKIDALLTRVGDDDRVRNAFRYHGAATGRWSGEGFQPQNLKRPTVENLDAAVTAVSTGYYAHVRSLYPKPLSVVGDCSRPMIVAAAGLKFFGGDLNAIESRVLAHVAGEAWKLDSYRRYDATHDPRDEPYCVTACKIFRVAPGAYTKDSPERSVGKTCDLAFGYMGGLNAWRKFEPDRFTDAEVEQFKTDWRAAHPAIVKFWYAVDRAAWTAVRERGRVIRCGPVAFKNNGAFLQLKLPSGRKLSYPEPRIRSSDDGCRQFIVFSDNSEGRFRDCRNGAGAYGGIWTENIVSGIARDLLAEAMQRVEAAGYPIVLHVHDELVCEVLQGFGSTQEFMQLMTCKPVWALDLPIAASVWSGSRYCK